MKTLYLTPLFTPLGEMIAIADESALIFLAFTDQPNIEQRTTKLAAQQHASITHTENAILKLVKTELDAYFAGNLTTFTVPLAPAGTPFQQRSWKVLLTVPYGQTSNYKHQAKNLFQPTAFRACANANARNMIAIIIPCHRIIKSNGDLCGYNGGLWRKEWLLKHEAHNLL